jgi:hypothetical protein
MINIAQTTIGATLSGRAFGAKSACGKISHIYPGLGFEVKKDGYRYLIIDDFSTRDFEMSHFVEPSAPDNLYHTLSKDTINFWMSAGYKTKERIYGKEIQHRKLIEQGSPEDVPYPFKTFPFIEPPTIERWHLDFENFLTEEQEEEDNRFQSSVRRLTSEEIMEGIESAHWEMSRIKRNDLLWHNNQDLRYHMDWLDAAWKEIDERNS